MSRQLTVYFTPVRSNFLVVEHLSKDPRFNFLPLHEEEPKRLVQLEKLPPGAAFIWGDGNHHHDSYHFTRNSGATVKLNFDQHDDTTGFWPPATFSTHMAVTEADGVRIETAIDTADRIADLVDDPSIMRSKIAVSVDCDGIRSFPACYHWMYYSPSSGLLAEDISGFLRTTGPQFVSLDIGGLRENIPDFTFIHQPEPPSLEDVRAVSRFAVHNSVHYPAAGPNRTNRVLSYAVHVYHEILSAYANVVSE